MKNEKLTVMEKIRRNGFKWHTEPQELLKMCKHTNTDDSKEVVEITKGDLQRLFKYTFFQEQLHEKVHDFSRNQIEIYERELGIVYE